MVLEDDLEFDHHLMLQSKASIQNNVLTKRKEQLKHWESSEVNKMTATRKPVRESKVKFQDSDIFLSACISGDEDEVEDLLQKGANINVSTVDGVTALHQAVIDDNIDIVRFLIKHEADINAQDNEGWTPLHAAVCCGSLPITKFLCEKGADLTLTNSDKELAIDLAEDDEIRLYLEEQLLKKKIDTEKCRELEFNLMMNDCAEWIQSGRYLDKPHPRTGATALHVAASKGYNQLIGMLIRAGADIKVQDKEGWTPLHAAAHWGEKDACRLLMENGANINTENYLGQTVLMVADKSIVEYLKELQQQFCDLRNSALEHQKQNFKENSTEKSISNCSTSNGDISDLTCNAIVSEIPLVEKTSKNDYKNTIRLTLISPNNSTNYASTSFNVKKSASTQSLTQYAGCTPKPKKSFRTGSLTQKIDSDNEEEEEEDVEMEEEAVEEEEIVYEEDEEVSAKTVGSSTSSKTKSVSNKSLEDVINNGLITENAQKTHNANIEPFNLCKNKKFERESSVASTSTCSDEKTGSNVSSIISTSRSVTPREQSLSSHNSDQNIECTVYTQNVVKPTTTLSDYTYSSAIDNSSVMFRKTTNTPVFITTTGSCNSNTYNTVIVTTSSSTLNIPYSESFVPKTVWSSPLKPLTLKTSSTTFNNNGKVNENNHVEVTENRSINNDSSTKNVNSFDNRFLKPTIATSLKISSKTASTTGQFNHINQQPITSSFSQQNHKLLPYTLKIATTLNGQNTNVSNFSSFQTPPTQPSSNKESESERKAKSRLQRHSRRSTQGVTLEHIGEASRQIQNHISSEENDRQKGASRCYLNKKEGSVIDDCQSNESLLNNGNSNTLVFSPNNASNTLKWRTQFNLVDEKINNYGVLATSKCEKNYAYNNSGNTSVNAVFKIPSHNYLTASSSTTSSSSNSQASTNNNTKNVESKINNSSTLSLGNQLTAAATVAKLNRRSQAMRGNVRRGTGPVDLEAVNVALLNRCVTQRNQESVSKSEKKTSLKPYLKNDSENVDSDDENILSNKNLTDVDDSFNNEKNYKLLYKKERETTEHLRKRIEELSSKQNKSSLINDQERCCYERRIIALEYEVEKCKQLRNDYEKLKDENLALIRVLKKLSK